MRKAFAYAAVVGLCGSVQAQSSVTIFGGVDVAYQHLSVSDSGSLNRMINGGSLTSRLGVRGVEDLGGGYAAGFWMEAGLNGDNGTGSASNANNQTIGAATPGLAGAQGITFNRRSTVSLFTPAGEFRLGRTENPLFWNQTTFDPFRTQGSGASINITTGAGLGTTAGLGQPTAGRISNSFTYLLPPKLGGVYGQITLGRGENSPTPAALKNDGNYAGARLGYEARGMHVALALTHTVYSTGNLNGVNLGASYNLGFATVMGQVARDERTGAASTRANYWLVGALVPAGPGTFRVSFGKTDVANTPNDATLAAIGYIYPFSKRTSAYTALARIDNKGTGRGFHQGLAVTAPGGKSTGFDIGIRHDF